jgi:uncharacterized repeat protein (TIGR03803 family)
MQLLPRKKKKPFGYVAALLSLNLLGLSLAAAQTETVLHNFTNTPDGAIPQGSALLRLGSSYYGATDLGGEENYGTVYKMAKTSSGNWNETVIYSFTGGNDGGHPLGALIADQAGNLYGAATTGGPANCGVVFKLTNSGGNWAEIVLYSFSGPDGSDPRGPLVFDKSGNLFGTTIVGGANSSGTAFELSPSNATWTETVLHSFGEGTDGYIPGGGLVFDAAGNLYGATFQGGPNNCIGVGCGVAFQLVPGNDGWTYDIVHAFQGRGDGVYPNTPLLIDASGNLYGSTEYGGGLGKCAAGIVTISCGTVYELSPGSNNIWNETILHRFIGGNGGSSPDSPLIFDSAGNLYGETAQAGSDNGRVFRLAPSTTGAWTLKIFFTFDGTNGANPQGGLIFGAGGTFLGTTIYGGTTNNGVVFELKP